MKLSFKEFLIEKRKNPSINPKHKNVDVLEKYKDDPDVYITFVSIKKVGINPQSDWGETPNGIYAYPVKEYWDKFNKESAVGHSVPYAGNAKYMAIIKYVGNGRFLRAIDKDYSDSDFGKDFEKLKKIVIDKGYTDKKRLNLVIQDYEKFKDKLSPAFKKMMYVLNEITYGLPEEKKTRIMGNILRNLGFDGMADTNGTGLIHPNEPIQAVFLKKSVIKVLDFVDNKDRRGKPNRIDITKELFDKLMFKNEIKYDFDEFLHRYNNNKVLSFKDGSNRETYWFKPKKITISQIIANDTSFYWKNIDKNDLVFVGELINNYDGKMNKSLASFIIKKFNKVFGKLKTKSVDDVEIFIHDNFGDEIMGRAIHQFLIDLKENI